MTFSPDGSRLATTGYEGSVKIWDTNSMQAEHEFVVEPKSWMMCAAFSPNGERLAAAGMDGICRVWDVRDGSLQTSFEAAGWLPSCEFSPNGKQLAVGGFLHHFDSGKTTRIAPGDVHVFSSDGVSLSSWPFRASGQTPEYAELVKELAAKGGHE